MVLVSFLAYFRHIYCLQCSIAALPRACQNAPTLEDELNQESFDASTAAPIGPEVLVILWLSMLPVTNSISDYLRAAYLHVESAATGFAPGMKPPRFCISWYNDECVWRHCFASFLNVENVTEAISRPSASYLINLTAQSARLSFSLFWREGCSPLYVCASRFCQHADPPL